MSANAKMGEPPLFSPDLRMVVPLFDAYLRDSKKYLAREYEDKLVSTNFASGFVGFLRSAILRYYEAGMMTEAQEKFDFLRSNFSDPMYNNGLEGFVAKQFVFDRELGDHRTVMARIKLLARDAFRMYAYDEDEQAVRRLARAKQVYDIYQRNTSSDRMKIPFSFAQTLESVTQDVDWSRTPRGTYEKICRKLGIEPLPQPPSSAPAEAGDFSVD
jgi:hypothetical protein